MTSEFPLYLSPSQVSSLGTCGEQFRLTRVLKVPERPSWASIGGSAVHRMTEDLDRALMGQSVTPRDWDFYWNEALDEAKQRGPEYDPSEYYAGGRVSKAWPNKENPDWWAENGPKFVRSWSIWLEASGLEIWEWPDESTGELLPAIELETMAEYGNLYVKSVIDRVLYEPVHGNLYIVDLKSGSHTAAWPQQMALNNLGFKQHPACPRDVPGALYAGFWKARKGGVENWFNLSIYSDEWLWDQVAKARQIRDNHLFIAQPSNLCASACGVRKYCRAMGGDSSFFEQHATLTQGKETVEDE